MTEFFHLFGGLGGILLLSGMLLAVAAQIMVNVGEERYSNTSWKLGLISALMCASGFMLLSYSGRPHPPSSHKIDSNWVKDELEKGINKRLEENKARLEELSQSPLWFAPHTADTPTKENGNRTGAICQDGWQSRATGRGACSHHGGVRYWLYE